MRPRVRIVTCLFLAVLVLAATAAAADDDDGPDKKSNHRSQKPRSASDDDADDSDDDKSFGLKLYGGNPGRSAKQDQDASKSLTAPPPSNALPTVSGEPFTVQPNEGRYTRFATAPIDADAFEFKFEAKAASGVHIAFMTSNQVQVAPARDANCYEVVIGGLRNSQSMIHLGNQGASLITKPTYHFNSDAQFNAFWVSLRGGLLTVGRGNVTGVQSFMMARVNPLIGRPTKLWVGFAAFDKPITFRYGEATRAVVSTVVDAEKEASPLIWMRKPFVVPANGGLYHAYSAATVKADDFDFVFQVQAIGDVRVGFLKSDTKQKKAASDCYEIILGARNNAYSQIRANNVEMISIPTPGLLSSQWLQTFWVSLHETVLEVGQGDRIGMRQVMAARVPPVKGAPRELFVGFAAWNSTANFVYGMKEADAAELVLPAPTALPTAAPKPSTTPTPTSTAAPSTATPTSAPRATTASPSAAAPFVTPHVPFTAPGSGGLYQRFSAAQVSAAGFAIVFQAQAEGGVLVAFAPSNASSFEQGYEVSIGFGDSHRQCAVRFGSGGINAPLIQVDAGAGVLSAFAMRTFWVSLQTSGTGAGLEHLLAVGLGKAVGRDQLMVAAVPALDARVTLLSVGFAAAGDASVTYIYQGQGTTSGAAAANPTPGAAVAIATEPREPFQVAANQGFYSFFANARVAADRFGLVFRAQTKDAVLIAFLTSDAIQTNERDANAYEVVIGGWKNSQSQIRLGTQGTALATKTTYHFNSATSAASFWIALRGGVLSVGKGTTLQQNTFMSVAVPALRGNPQQLYVGFGAFDVPVTYSYDAWTTTTATTTSTTTTATTTTATSNVAVATPAPTATVRPTDADPASLLSPSIVYTGTVFVVPGNHAFYTRFANESVNARQFSFVFSAQAEDGVFVSFLTSDRVQLNRDMNGYEVGIGSDSAIRIGNQGQDLFKLTTPNFNSVELMRTFWIALRDNVLTVGRGDRVGELQFMASRVPDLRGDPDRLYVGFAGWSSSVMFVYGISERAASTIHRSLPPPPPPTFGPEPMPTQPSSVSEGDHSRTRARIPFVAPGNQGFYWRFANFHLPYDEFAFVFSAQTASAAHLSLSTSDVPQLMRDQNCYEIQIGAQRNSQSSIRFGSGADGVALITKPTYHFLSSKEMRLFWVALRGGVLSVGHGARIGSRTFMQSRVPRLHGKIEHLHVGFAGWDRPVVYTYEDIEAAIVAVEQKRRDEEEEESETESRSRPAPTMRPITIQPIQPTPPTRAVPSDDNQRDAETVIPPPRPTPTVKAKAKTKTKAKAKTKTKVPKETPAPTAEPPLPTRHDGPCPFRKHAHEPEHVSPCPMARMEDSLTDASGSSSEWRETKRYAPHDGPCPFRTHESQALHVFPCPMAQTQITINIETGSHADHPTVTVDDGTARTTSAPRATTKVPQTTATVAPKPTATLRPTATPTTIKPSATTAKPATVRPTAAAHPTAAVHPTATAPTAAPTDSPTHDALTIDSSAGLVIVPKNQVTAPTTAPENDAWYASVSITDARLLIAVICLGALLLTVICFFCCLRFCGCTCCGIGKKDTASADLTAVRTVASTQENVAFETVANHAFYQRFADHTLNAHDFEFHFQAKGLDSAHVAFLTHSTEQSNTRDDNCLEIVIGGWGNTQSLIRVGNQGRVLASQTTRNFLSATEMQSFWACMRNGVLSVGRGRTVGAMEFMSARVPTLSMRSDELHVGFASWESNVTYMYSRSSSSHHRAVSQHRTHLAHPHHHHPHRSHQEAVSASHVESSYSTSLLIGE